MIKNLKNNKGIVVADALIAVLIMAIFSGLVITLTYNIYISASFTKRNSTALNYGINIVEYIEKTNYLDITEENLIKYINENLDEKVSAETAENQSNLTTPYKVILDVEKYNETEGNTDKQDLIKKITLKVKYNLGDAEKEVNFERIKKGI